MTTVIAVQPIGDNVLKVVTRSVVTVGTELREKWEVHYLRTAKPSKTHAAISQLVEAVADAYAKDIQKAVDKKIGGAS